MSRVGFLALSLVFAVSLRAQDSIVCDIRDDGIEKLVCTFKTKRKNVPRSATFFWHSETHPQDDRERTIELPANHGSVYDYRYLRGRAQGVWTLTVRLEDSDGSVTETEHHFLLENEQLVNESN